MGAAPGLVWLTEADVRDLAEVEDALTCVLNLRLAEPAAAAAFADERHEDSVQGPSSAPLLATG